MGTAQRWLSPHTHPSRALSRRSTVGFRQEHGAPSPKTMCTQTLGLGERQWQTSTSTKPITPNSTSDSAAEVRPRTQRRPDGVCVLLRGFASVHLHLHCTRGPLASTNSCFVPTCHHRAACLWKWSMTLHPDGCHADCSARNAPIILCREAVSCVAPALPVPGMDHRCRGCGCHPRGG